MTMPHSDARKQPWHLDLTPAQLEEALKMWPLLWKVAQRAAECKRLGGYWQSDVVELETAVATLDAQHPTWRTWLTVEQQGDGHGR